MRKLSELELDLLELKVTQAAAWEFRETILSLITIWAGLIFGILVAALVIHFLFGG